MEWVETRGRGERCGEGCAGEVEEGEDLLMRSYVRRS